MAEHAFEEEAARLFAAPPVELDGGQDFIERMEHRMDAYIAVRRRVMTACSLAAAAATAFVFVVGWSAIVRLAPRSVADNLGAFGVNIGALSTSASPLILALAAVAAIGLLADSDPRGI